MSSSSGPSCLLKSLSLGVLHIPSYSLVKRGRREQSTQCLLKCQLLMTFDAARGIPATLNQRVVSCLLYFGLWIIAETLLIFGSEALQIGCGSTSALRSQPGEGFSCLLG